MPTLSEPIIDNKYQEKTGKKLSEVDPVSSGMDIARQYFYGFNEMLYTTSGAGLVDMAASGMGLADEGTVGQWVKKNVFRVGDTKPKNRKERIARSAGQGTGFGALTAMGTGIVAQLTSKAPLSAKTSERVMSSIVDGFRSNPISYSILETITAGTSEMAVKAVEEAGGGTTAKMLAGVGGGMAPVMVGQVAKNLPMAFLWRRLLGSEETTARAVNQVSRALKTGIGDEDDLVRANRAFDDLGVNRPTVAEGSNSPQLLKKQTEIESHAQGAELDYFAKRKIDTGQAIREAGLEQGPPGSITDEAAVVSAVDDRMRLVRRTFDDHLDDIEHSRRRLSNQVAETDRVEVGSILRERRNQLKESVSQEFSSRADEIGLNDPDGGFNATNFINEIEARFFNKNNRFANSERPGILKTIRALRSGKETAPGLNGSEDVIDDIQFTFDDVKALRQRLDDDISDNINDNRSVARELIEAKKMLDDWFDNVQPSSNINPEDWAKFRSDYKEGFIRRFEQGVPHRISRRTPRGDYQTRDEAVAGAFLKNEGTVGDFYRVYSDENGNVDPEAYYSMYLAVLDEVRSYAVKDGILDERALGRWLNSKRKVIDLLPEIKAKLSNIRVAAQNLSRREAVMQKRKKAVERSALKSLMLERGNPTEMVDAALSDPIGMRALIRASESAGLRRDPVKSLVWERAIDTISPTGMPSPSGLGAFLRANQKTLRILYNDSPEHLRKLNDIYFALEVINRTPVPTGAAQASGVIGRVEQYVGTGIAQASSRVFAVQSGRTGRVYPFIDGAVRFLDRMSKRKADALMKQAIFDPKIADDVHFDIK
jgi:hypothetical protein